jgi:glycosyltransferase involved in cell wall biosynthesis
MQSEKKNNKKRVVYFLAPAPIGISPGQRFRFEHYLKFLQQRGIVFKLSGFYSADGWKLLYTTGNYFQKFFIVCKGFFKRVVDLFKIPFYQYVYIYREAAPVGPPVFEWVIAKLLKKKIIYDFDDAIWIPAISEQNRIARYLKWFSKIGTICKLSYQVTVGNKYLADFVRVYNRNVIVIPTVVDTVESHNVLQNQRTFQPVVGWTGTFSTLKYLQILLPVLQKLQEKIDFTFAVIADKDPKLPLKKYRFIPWRKDTEIQDLLTIHIGVMPLYNNPIEKGKCGFKAIQYMALGIPALVSPVGVNSEIVNDAEDGFVCRNNEEWENCLTQLLQSTEKRIKMGAAAKYKIEAKYSVLASKDLFTSLFVNR